MDCLKLAFRFKHIRDKEKHKQSEAKKLTDKTENELKLILKECEERFTSVYKEKNLSFEEQELVRSLFFEQITTEQLAVCINRLKRFRSQKPTSKEVNSEKDNPIITDEQCGLCGLKSTSDKLVKHIRFDPGSELNYDYYYCPNCDNEINEINKLSYKELTKQIRQILKSYSKKLSITNPDGWLKIRNTTSKYGNQLTKEEEKTLNMFGLNYGNGLLRTSIKGSSLAYWLIKIKRIHAKNQLKTTKKPNNSSNGSFIIKVKQSGELACFIPRKVFKVLYNQEIITKQGSKWIVDLSKQELIKIPLEVVG